MVGIIFYSMYQSRSIAAMNTSTWHAAVMHFHNRRFFYKHNALIFFLMTDRRHVSTVNSAIYSCCYWQITLYPSVTQCFSHTRILWKITLKVLDLPANTFLLVLTVGCTMPRSVWITWLTVCVLLMWRLKLYFESIPFVCASIKCVC